MEAKHTPGFVEVSQREFFDYVGPRDILVRSGPHITSWETRNRIEVGRSYPGYSSVSAKRTYLLSEAARAAIAKAAPQS